MTSIHPTKYVAINQGTLTLEQSNTPELIIPKHSCICSGCCEKCIIAREIELHRVDGWRVVDFTQSHAMMKFLANYSSLLTAYYSPVMYYSGGVNPADGNPE